MFLEICCSGVANLFSPRTHWICKNPSGASVKHVLQIAVWRCTYWRCGSWLITGGMAVDSLLQGMAVDWLVEAWQMTSFRRCGTWLTVFKLIVQKLQWNCSTMSSGRTASVDGTDHVPNLRRAASDQWLHTGVPSAKVNRKRPQKATRKPHPQKTIFCPNLQQIATLKVQENGLLFEDTTYSNGMWPRASEQVNTHGL